VIIYIASAQCVDRFQWQVCVGRSGNKKQQSASWAQIPGATGGGGTSPHFLGLPIVFAIQTPPPQAKFPPWSPHFSQQICATGRLNFSAIVLSCWRDLIICVRYPGEGAWLIQCHVLVSHLLMSFLYMHCCCTHMHVE